MKRLIEDEVVKYLKWDSANRELKEDVVDLVTCLIENDRFVIRAILQKIYPKEDEPWSQSL